MQATHARYRAASAKAVRDVFATWLDTLPPDGWGGTVVDLEAALEVVKAKHRLRGSIPHGNGLGIRIRAETPFLEAQGFALAFHRTAAMRTIRIARTAKGESNSKSLTGCHRQLAAS